MNRRDMLKSVGLIVGSAVVGSDAYLMGRVNTTKANEDLLSAERIALLDEIGETILPKTTDTPGAKDAKVGTFMNRIVTDFYTESEQKAFLEGVREFEFRKFISLTHEEREAFIRDIEAKIKENPTVNSANEAGRNTSKEHPYILIKQLTVWGFLASETVAASGFEYVPIPGRYDDCVEVNHETKAMYSNPSLWRARGITQVSLKLD